MEKMIKSLNYHFDGVSQISKMLRKPSLIFITNHHSTSKFCESNLLVADLHQRYLPFCSQITGNKLCLYSGHYSRIHRSFSSLYPSIATNKYPIMMTRISFLLLVLSASVFHHAEAFTTTTGSIRRMSTTSSHVATRNTFLSMKKKGTDQNDLSIDEMNSMLAKAKDFVKQFVQKKESSNKAIPKKMPIDSSSDDGAPKKVLKSLIDPCHDIPKRYQALSKKQQQSSKQTEKLVSQEESDETEAPKPIMKKKTIKNNGAGTLGQRYSKKINDINKAREMMECTQKLVEKEHAENILKAESMMAITTQLLLDQGNEDWNVMQ